MSNETLIGVIITVVLGVAAFFVTTKKNKVTIRQKNKDGNINMNNNNIGNIFNIYNDKKRGR